MKPLFFCWILGALLSTRGLAQDRDLSQIETDLVKLFEVYRAADYELRYDSVRPALRNRMEAVFSEVNTLNYPFDSLGKTIKMIASDDGKVRVLSWDEATGGTWHDMAVLVQYLAADGSLHVEWIDSDIAEEPNGLTPDLLYEMHTLKTDQDTYYLCFGWGTFGSGHHHNSLFVFSIADTGVTVCDACIDERLQFIFAPRGAQIDLRYDTAQWCIRFNTFVMDNETGFYRPTGGITQLQWNGSRFVTVEE
ncbi:MAG TPA: hypothetical protein PKW08_07315 [Flavobacteriaceae bacterium]|nr:hypothetical protein [Flavobacteriaceae bacterium]MCB9212751.1 hypothetical protein [Alteromonas sp.]HPF10083.1 hypothetical protein [Flavobacteriaceae bacterium]HQU21382.1 hypothetical protein [Flavobacteriaceae bacterium]HQU63834.1 hypothetical protein [Flavobacteriaceae bacterium]